MVESLKRTFIFIFGLVFGFGVWFLIVWFLTNKMDPFMWSPFVKIVYLILSLMSSTGITEELNK